MKPKLSEIIIGIMYQKAFRLLDDAGAVFDKILYDSKCFSTDYFPQIQYDKFQKVLKNNDTGNYLSMTADNVVYRHKVESEKADSEINDMISRVQSTIVPVILEAYRLSISRIGIVFSYDVDKASLDKFKSKYFKDGVDVSAFRFSISDGTMESAVPKERRDYTNMIFTISREEDHYKIAFDYQAYFYPFRASWDDCHPNNFFTNAKKTLEEKLLSDLESAK